MKYIFLIAAVLSPALSFSQSASIPSKAVLFFGPNISPAVQFRIQNLIEQSDIQVLVPTSPKVPIQSDAAFSKYVGAAKGKTIFLSFGDHPVSNWILSGSSFRSAGPEAYAIKSKSTSKGLVIATDGNPADPNYLPVHLKKQKGSRGAHYGAFVVLEKLGFGFLHPLKPLIPKGISLGSVETLNIISKPHWPIRTIHLHTMHPIELTDLLNAWGPNGLDDGTGWTAELPYWANYLDWLLANKQNHVQWVLLEKDSWLAFSQSPTRRERLAKLVQMAQEVGIFVGIDVPIALEQQNSFRLIRKTGTLEAELQQLRSRIDWLMDIGFDYISTELGYSEFTSPSADKMLAWMNAFSTHLKETWKSKGETKAHVSLGQKAKGFKDPVSGVADSNFNFLTYHANKDLGVLVHTVQHYGLTDPAPTYGRQDFKNMFLYLKAESGKRQVLWYPETAYWVSFDIDVPLFLPLYAERRLTDVRFIANAEKSGEIKPIQGQTIFSSGWEWGYWLNDVIAARAAWDPRLQEKSDAVAFQLALEDALSPMKTRGLSLAKKISALVKDQYELLILGKMDNWSTSSDNSRRTGQGYLQGWDTWDDLPWGLSDFKMFKNGTTQPGRKPPSDTLKNSSNPPNYLTEIKPLLQRMENQFAKAAQDFQSDRLGIADFGFDLDADLVDAMELTSLRARQIHGLYDSAAQTPPGAERRLEARASLDQALVIVKRREAAYRMPAHRLASWSPGPTSYRFRYLWTVNQLYYWYRDEALFTGKANGACFLNIIDPAEVVSAEGADDWRFRSLRYLTRWLGPVLRPLDQCVNPPTTEPSIHKLVRE